MSKKVVVISTSLRRNSNSAELAKKFAEGARDAGNDVEEISLVGKKIAFCTGCLACQKIGHCVINDDAVAIEPVVLNADVVVFARRRSSTASTRCSQRNIVSVRCIFSRQPPMRVTIHQSVPRQGFKAG